MTLEEFLQLEADGYNRIPVSRVLPADLDTPLSIYLKATLTQQRGTFLFESMHGGERWGRYSIVGLPCDERIEVRGNTIRQMSGNDVTNEHLVDDPLRWLEEFQNRIRVPDLQGLPRITGGLVGYFSYDTVRHVEPKLGQNRLPDPIDTPDMLFLVCNESVSYTHLTLPTICSV